ncbi:MAG: TrmB family transcriptional regulator, partial [Anaerolineales bacterium]|nr:TrmB family transcriptional regulator [Anaerolineales bacterium]
MLKELTTIGFTEYEAKVYLALLAENPANGYQVSKHSGVPRSMVYEALGRLEARGAVLKKEDRRATLYRPVPPDVLLDHYEEEHQRTLETLRTGLRSVYETQ